MVGKRRRRKEGGGGRREKKEGGGWREEGGERRKEEGVFQTVHSAYYLFSRSILAASAIMLEALDGQDFVLERWRRPQIDKISVLESSRRRWIDKNSVLEGSRRRWIGKKTVLEVSRRRWIDQISVPEGSRRFWIEENSECFEGVQERSRCSRTPWKGSNTTPVVFSEALPGPRPRTAWTATPIPDPTEAHFST